MEPDSCSFLHFIHNVYIPLSSMVQLQLLKWHLNHNKAIRFMDAEKQLDVHVFAVAWIMISGSAPGILSTVLLFVYVRWRNGQALAGNTDPDAIGVVCSA